MASAVEEKLSLVKAIPLSLFDLPVEMIVNIVSRMPGSFPSLHRLLLVNKRLYQIVQPLFWESIRCLLHLSRELQSSKSPVLIEPVR